MNRFDKEFWEMMDKLFENHEIVVDRPKGSAHPKYSDYIYPLDYGYLDRTSSSDGAGIDVWIGSEKSRRVSAIISSVDIIKGDSEIKILFSCNNEEIEMIYKHHNRSEGMKGLLNIRGGESD